MLLNTFPFFVFFVLVFYFVLEDRQTFSVVLLLLASSIFSALVLPYLALIIVTTAVNYFLCTGMGRFRQYKKYFLLSALAIDLAILFIFKYYNFFTSPFKFPALNLLLPIAFSFYTFSNDRLHARCL